MRILIAVDENPYSAHAVDKVAKFAANTWANVTLLAVQSKTALKREVSDDPSAAPAPAGALAKMLRTYRERFLSYFKNEECPYLQRHFRYELLETRRGMWEELYVSRSARKDLKVRLRIGNPAKQILAESREEESDLIVLGCNSSKGCIWDDAPTLPQKLVTDADCSVLIVKEEIDIKKIVCCLDHDKVSHQSLEMINQLVTLHQARLEIVGLTEGAGLRGEVEKKLDVILRYYTARKLEPLVEVVEVSALGSFISQEAQWGMMALWMGRRSILETLFPRRRVTTLVRESKSSVLILR